MTSKFSWKNSISLCPASFRIPRPNLPVTPGVSFCLSFFQSDLSSEKAMAPHSSNLVWKIPWAKEPCRLQSMGSQRVRHD